MGSIDKYGLTHHATNGSQIQGSQIQSSTTSSQVPIQELDALIVGAGFGGCYQLNRLRSLGFNVKIVEAGGDYGGVWYWNRYPGARVDIQSREYQFSDPELWKDWSWSQRFPDSAELRAYFRYVAKKWDLRKDTIFDCFVSEATWRNEEKRWIVKGKGKDGGVEVWRVKWFLVNTGYASKRYIPDWEGVDNFKGSSCTLPK
jgi:cation diffusion facilitator CzcD-associated flavoprotein CzcO